MALPRLVTDVSDQPVAGAAWGAFERLSDIELQDSSSYLRMLPEQRLLFAIQMLRQEVNSGGFDSYFRYTGGNSAPDAKLAARLISPPWELLIAEACGLFGDPYPVDIDVRERAVDEVDEAGLDRLDQALYSLEVEYPVDQILDRYVWSHPAVFSS
jgi:hypothetical protein